MNLLIVDDQINVVDGLREKVDWKSYDINKVFGAYSAAEAQQIIRGNKINILLCDIEMPVENGLSLISWIKAFDSEIRCILLTAHANFAYAHQSLKLNVFDYLLQPAPYEKIAAAVKHAADDINKSDEEKQLVSYGKELIKREDSIARGVFRSIINGFVNKEEIASYVKLKMLPEKNDNVHLMLLQILRWTKVEEWTAALLTAAFQNIISEVFQPYGQTVIVASYDKGELAVLLWKSECEIAESGMEQQFNFILSVCRQYFNCIAAVYTAECTAADIPEGWKDIVSMRDNNVARQEKVFMFEKHKAEIGYSFRLPEISRWTSILKGEYPQTVEEEAFRYLDDIVRAEKLDARVLREFYQDYLHAFHIALGEDDSFWRETLNDQKNYEIYYNGARSVDDMKALVSLTVAYLTSKTSPPEKELLDKINDYIDKNLEYEINRSDLAAHVYLNPDYLNRIFKQMTGNSLKEYIIIKKMEAAKSLLLTTNLPISIVAAKVGYGHLSHFSTAYKKMFSESPLKTRQQIKKVKL